MNTNNEGLTGLVLLVALVISVILLIRTQGGAGTNNAEGWEITRGPATSPGTFGPILSMTAHRQVRPFEV